MPASLHLILGPGGLHSFGHAAYFGLGADGAALAGAPLDLPMEAALLLGPLVAAAGALLYGWFCVRLSGVYLTMLTLAFAQITWAIVFQWDEFTGGSNGRTGRVAPAGPSKAPRSTGWRWLSAPWAFICCAAFCSRPWAMHCAPRAIRRCAPMPLASTCAAFSGRRL